MATLGEFQRHQSQVAREAAAPVVQSLQAQRQPIIDRYQGILDQISAEKESSISGTQRTTSREFGRRGIPLSSGIFGTTLEQNLQPIRRNFAGLLSETGAGREQSLADLATRIAAVRSGALETGASRAFDIFSLQESRKESALDREAARKAGASSPLDLKKLAEILGIDLDGDGASDEEPVDLGRAARDIQSSSSSFQEARAKVAGAKGLTQAERTSLIRRVNKLYSKLVKSF